MGLQKVEHDLVTEQQWAKTEIYPLDTFSDFSAV